MSLRIVIALRPGTAALSPLATRATTLSGTIRTANQIGVTAKTPPASNIASGLVSRLLSLLHRTRRPTYWIQPQEV
jgi:hypothetical protein